MKESGPEAGRKLPRQAQKGQGAQSNLQSRFIHKRSEPVDDGWSSSSEELQSSQVTLLPDRTVSLLTRNRSPDIPFDRSINPYKGCEHGCIYCFARPTHAYLDLSPGVDFERKIFYKTDVQVHLRQLFAKPGYLCAPIAMGTNTDPYQPVERRQRITRQILETLLEHRHPVSIVTKGQCILRDLDLLGALAQLKLVKVMVSVTTLSLALKTRLEPRTASPNKRLAVIAELAGAGVPVGAMVAPVIPFVNDDELEDIVAACVGRGARELNYILLRLPAEVAPLFEEWLRVHYPLKAERVMNVIRNTRGGKAYDARWGERMRGRGPFAELLSMRFRNALKRHGLQHAPPVELRTDLFRAQSRSEQPAVFARQRNQGDLFASPSE